MNYVLHTKYCSFVSRVTLSIVCLKAVRRGAQLLFYQQEQQDNNLAKHHMVFQTLPKSLCTVLLKGKNNNVTSSSLTAL